MEQPLTQYTYIGWGHWQWAISLLIGVLLGVSVMTGLLYLRMGDVANALQAQAASCAKPGSK